MWGPRAQDPGFGQDPVVAELRGLPNSLECCRVRTDGQFPAPAARAEEPEQAGGSARQDPRVSAWISPVCSVFCGLRAHRVPQGLPTGDDAGGIEIRIQQGEIALDVIGDPALAGESQDLGRNGRGSVQGLL